MGHLLTVVYLLVNNTRLVVHPPIVNHFSYIWLTIDRSEGELGLLG